LNLKLLLGECILSVLVSISYHSNNQWEVFFELQVILFLLVCGAAYAPIGFHPHFRVLAVAGVLWPLSPFGWESGTQVTSSPGLVAWAEES
jgi:hypothetical protein